MKSNKKESTTYCLYTTIYFSACPQLQAIIQVSLIYTLPVCYRQTNCIYVPANLMTAIDVSVENNADYWLLSGQQNCFQITPLLSLLNKIRMIFYNQAATLCN